jgi:transcriptional regulator with XRE-family HTH domain
MTQRDAKASTVPQTRGKTALAELRAEAGYKNAKDFAAVLGVPTSTYSRWERGAQGPDSAIPMAAAWSIADKLGTTIDVIVGREPKPATRDRDLNAFYGSLSEGGKHFLDEITRYIDFRERVLATEGR